MKFDKKNVSIQVLALIGFGLAIKLAFIYYTANYDKYALSSFCAINDFIDCDGAAKTNYSQFLGIPLAWWGIFFYIIVLFLTVVDKIKKIKLFSFLEVFKEPKAYITVLGTISFLVSMTLAGISLFVIHKLCILCVATYFIDFVIALIASEGMFKNIVKAFKTTFFDFLEGVKRFPKTTVVLIVLAFSFLAYSAVSLDFVPHIKLRKNILEYRKIKVNPYRVKGNLLGVEGADVVIELYSDYVCPLCYVNNIMLHQAVKEFKNIRIQHHNFPFDKECNPYITVNMHPQACFMSRAAIAAGEQGNYWEMGSLLYENQPKSKEDVLKLVEQAGLDKDKFLASIDSSKVLDEIKKELDAAEQLEIDATPTMYINGEKVVGVKPYYTLKEILIKHGAKKR